MKPALLTVVCPLDNDVIYDMLVHYYNIGIRDFYLMLHKPDIELEKNIDKFCKHIEKNTNVFCYYNKTDEHYHDRDLKVLSDAARQDGCDWLIASDADELLVLKRHNNIIDFLNNYNNSFESGYGQLLFSWYEYRTLENVYQDAFNKIVHREPIARQQTKCIGKLDDTMSYVPGAHYIANHKTSIIIPKEYAFYAHFSDRNEKQYCDKMRLQSVNWHNRYGAYTHWAEKLIEDDPQGLEKLWNTMLDQNKNNGNLINDKIYV